MPVTIDKIEEVYLQFRKSQADYNNRGYRMPKSFETHFNEKMSEQNKKSLIKISGYFLTKWYNVNPYEYFNCGFELLKKGFTYTRFFDDKIILLYKTRDKIKKREIKLNKEQLIKSALFVKKWMNKNNKNLYDYISERNGQQRIAIYDYINNNIDAMFLVFLIQKGMILTDTERSVIPYVQKNYRDILFELDNIKYFVKKLEDKLI